MSHNRPPDDVPLEGFAAAETAESWQERDFDEPLQAQPAAGYKPARKHSALRYLEERRERERLRRELEDFASPDDVPLELD